MHEDINKLIEAYFAANYKSILSASKFRGYDVQPEDIEPGVVAIRTNEHKTDCLDFMKNYRIGTIRLSYFGTITKDGAFEDNDIVGVDTAKEP